MARKDDSEFADISILKGEAGRKSISNEDLHEAISKVNQSLQSVLEVFAAATEQIKIEDKDIEADARKHEAIVAKLDKLIEQNKTIAEGMVAVVDVIKERIPQAVNELSQKQEPQFKPQPWAPQQDTRQMPAQPQVDWNPKPEPAKPMAPMQPQMAQPMTAPMAAPMASSNGSSFMPPPPMPSDFGTELPNLGMPEPDIKTGDEPPMPEDRRKGLFGAFRK